MYFNYLPRSQWKYLQCLLQIHQMQLLRRYVDLSGKSLVHRRQQPLFYYHTIQRHCCNNLYEDKRKFNGCLDELNTEDPINMKPFQESLDLMKDNHWQSTDYAHDLTLLWTYYRRLTEPSMKQVLTSQLQHVMPLLAQNIPYMNVDDLCVCYLYLRKMYVPNSELALEHILLRVLSIIKNGGATGELVPLTALSRLSVGINLERNFFTPLVCRHFIPHLENYVAECNSEQHVRLLATCIFQLHTLIDEQLLTAYKLRVTQLMESGVLSCATPKALLKLLHMLNLPAWSQRHTQLIREVMLMLRPCLMQLEPSDLKAVCRTYMYQQEPATLTQPLREATEALFRLENSPEALSCAVAFADPQQREAYIEQFRTLLFSKDAWLLPNSSAYFFSVLRALKISDVKTCDVYWSAVVTELNACPEEQSQLRFLRHCQRYMNFNNNLGGTYRHHEVERKLCKMCMRAIEYDVAGRLPNKFSRLASFVMAYGHTPFAWKKFPNLLLSKILTMSPQFDIQDCNILSRGTQIACDLRFRHNIPDLVRMQLSTIDSILIACAERHLANWDQQPLIASELNIIVRTLSHRKSLKNSMVYNQALELYKTIDCIDLSSRIVRDMAYNFNTSNFFVPQLLDSMFAYVAQQHAHVTGDTVEKVLTCAYNLGYTPASLESLNCAATVLLREFNTMSGLALVQSCLALCFYKAMPEQLINQVFCVKFIQRIEDEIQICYSKATYPERVLHLVMQLNRTVCLDLPEVNVPWFQQNFVQAQMNKKPFAASEFGNDIQILLKELLKDDRYFRCNHTTPYGYQIDFVIHFDKDKKPIPTPPVETTMLDRITKVAILLLKLDSFCENDLTAMRGPMLLKMKHLEMMGYKVLHINEHDWNSKYLMAPGAKATYLKCLLQISN